MKTGGYARNVGPSALPLCTLPRDQVLANLGNVFELGLIEYVDLDAMGVKLKRYAPRVKDDWSWASRV
jgi:hypothetical protein